MEAALVPEDLGTAPGVPIAIGYVRTADRVGGDLHDVLEVPWETLFPR